MANKGRCHRRRIPDAAAADGQPAAADGPPAAADGRAAADGHAGAPAPSAPRSCGDDEAVQALLNASHERAVLLSPDGTVLACNEAAARAFGRSAAETVGAGPPDLVGPELCAQRKAVLAEVVRTGRPIRHEDQRDGRILLSSVHPVFGADGRVARVAVFCSDVTEQRLAEGRLRAGERRFRELAALLPETVVETDAEGILTFINRWGLRAFGYTPAEVAGGFDVRRAFVPEDRARLWEAAQRVMAGEDLGGTEFTALRKDGTTFPVLAHASRIVEGAAPVGLRGIAVDITARKRAEGELRAHGRRLRSLMAELALTEERERKRIAADLHDTVGHSIALARMKLEAIRWSASADEVPQLLAEAGRLIEQAGGDIGAAIHDLRPPALYDKGLEAALAATVEDLRRQAPHIRFAFTADGQPPPLSEDARIVLFRAARELLINVIRHARARTARLRLGRNGPHVRLEVADDGVGLDAAAGPGPEGSKGGLGLLSIRERVEYLGGSVRVDSAPNRGTRVVLELPAGTQRPPAPGQRPTAV